MAENSHDFIIQQQRAMERMREMNRRSVDNKKGSGPAAPHFAEIKNGSSYRKAPPVQNIYKPSNDNIASPITGTAQSSTEPPKPVVTHSKSSIFSDIKIPFLKNLGKDPDIALIIGLILILSSEKSDRYLLLALLYILM